MKKAIALSLIMAVIGAVRAAAQEPSPLGKFTDDIARHWRSAAGGEFDALPIPERISIIAWCLQQQPKDAATRSKISAITAELNDLVRFFGALADDRAVNDAVARFTGKLERGDAIKEPPAAARIFSGPVPDFLSGGRPAGRDPVRISRPPAESMIRDLADRIADLYSRRRFRDILPYTTGKGRQDLEKALADPNILRDIGALASTIRNWNLGEAVFNETKTEARIKLIYDFTNGRTEVQTWRFILENGVWRLVGD